MQKFTDVDLARDKLSRQVVLELQLDHRTDDVITCITFLQSLVAGSHSTSYISGKLDDEFKQRFRYTLKALVSKHPSLSGLAKPLIRNALRRERIAIRRDINNELILSDKERANNCVQFLKNLCKGSYTEYELNQFKLRFPQTIAALRCKDKLLCKLANDLIGEKLAVLVRSLDESPLPNEMFTSIAAMCDYQALTSWRGTNRFFRDILQVEQRKKLPFFLVSGNGHTIYCLNQKCWVWGCNASGQLGLGDRSKRPTPTELGLSFLKEGECICAIESGHDHTLLITDHGRLLAWGANYYGGLGLGDSDDRLTPTELDLSFLKEGEHVRTIKCGQYYTLLLTDQRRLLACGDNNCGQLGLGDTKNRLTPTELELGFLNKGESIRAVECGEYHGILCTDHGRLLAWGYNDCGQLGLGDTKTRLFPTELELDFLNKGEGIHAIGCGGYNTFLRTNQGRLFVWGKNHSGQLGLGDIDHRLTPTELDLSFLNEGEYIHAIESGGEQIFLITDHGRLLAWGGNHYGELGLGCTDARLIPTELELSFLKVGEHVHAIECGPHHTIIFTDQGRLLGCGSNGLAQLRLSDEEDKNYSRPIELLTSLHLRSQADDRTPVSTNTSKDTSSATKQSARR